MPSPLRALADLISSQVDVIEANYAKAGVPFPSLDEPFRPGPLDRDIPTIQATQLVVAAAAQLLATVRSPIETVQEAATAVHLTTALGFVEEANIVDILFEGGPSGVHVNAISEVCGVEASYISRVLRYLATRHIFLELTPDVFTNNRLSTLLKKPKSVQEIKANAVTKYEAAPFASFVSGCADEVLATAPHVSKWLFNPSQATAPFNLALNTQKKMWEWLSEPGNEWRNIRFVSAMKGGADAFPPEIFIHGFDWASLPKDALCVDVGGSIGTLTFSLVKAFPHLKFIVQDLEPQTIAGKGWWQEQHPDAIASGQVQLQTYDFFTPQPVKGAAIYFMRAVLHDWSDKEAAKIMKNVRDAADSGSKLVVFDSLAVHTCEDPRSSNKAPKPPYPLLNNLGLAGQGFFTSIDMQMLTQFDGKERTEQDFINIGKQTGWKLESVKPAIMACYVFSAI